MSQEYYSIAYYRVTMLVGYIHSIGAGIIVTWPGIKKTPLKLRDGHRSRSLDHLRDVSKDLDQIFDQVTKKGKDHDLDCDQITI